MEAVGRLVAAVDNDNNPLGLNIKNAVRELDSRISDAIMQAMERGPLLEEKVSARVFHIHIQQEAGLPDLLDRFDRRWRILMTDQPASRFDVDAV